MIVPDTSVLSSLAKIRYLQIIRDVFPGKQIVICSATMKELLVSKEKGYEFVDRIIEHIAYKGEELNSSRWLLVRYPDEEVSMGINEAYGKYPYIHFGEIEAIVFSKKNNAALLIDDRRAWAVAKEEGIEAFTLPALIQYAKIIEIIGLEEVRNIVRLLEKKDRYRFKHDVKQMLLE